MPSFAKRLWDLGFKSYDEYLASPQWKAFRQKYYASGCPTRCAVCKTPDAILHHHTYERLGCEHVDDVTPLCRRHHDEVHAFLKANNLFVDSTGKAVAACQGKYEPKKSPPAPNTGHRKRPARQHFGDAKPVWRFCETVSRRCDAHSASVILQEFGQLLQNRGDGAGSRVVREFMASSLASVGGD